jgi:Domain of unknown function (DUF4329)
MINFECAKSWKYATKVELFCPASEKNWRLLIVIYFLTSCAPSEENLIDNKTLDVVLQSSQIQQLAKTALNEIQGMSIMRNTEYCGYVVSRGSKFSVIGPAMGTRLGCRTPLVYKPHIILASFHSHGAFDVEAKTEFPSTTDFDAAKKEKIDAFVGTPGGRIWRIDFKSSTAFLVCGPENCLEIDRRVPSESLPTSLRRSEVLQLEGTVTIRR